MHFSIFKELHKFILVHMVHGSKINIVPYSGHDKGLSQRIRRIFYFAPQVILHPQNQVIVLLLYIPIIRTFTEILHMGFIKEINHIGTCVVFSPIIQNSPYLSKVLRIIRLIRLFIIQALGTALRYTHIFVFPSLTMPHLYNLCINIH